MDIIILLQTLGIIAWTCLLMIFGCLIADRLIPWVKRNK